MPGALLALLGPSRVDPLVVDKMRPLTEALTADVTYVRPLSSVHPLVCVEM